jgi:hypothetical protein
MDVPDNGALGVGALVPVLSLDQEAIPLDVALERVGATAQQAAGLPGGKPQLGLWQIEAWGGGLHWAASAELGGGYGVFSELGDGCSAFCAQGFPAAAHMPEMGLVAALAPSEMEPLLKQPVALEVALEGAGADPELMGCLCCGEPLTSDAMGTV